MAIRPRNLTRGGGKRLKSRIEGVKELEAKFRDLISLFQDKAATSGKARLLKREVTETLHGAADMIAREARSNAASQNVPSRVQRSIFTYANPAKDKPRRSAALVGVNKKRSMVEWVAAPNNKSPRAKVGAGGKVAMSLAAMFERGTSRMKARPYFTPAVKSMRERALSYLIHGYKAILEKFNPL
jgi:HK97 gp10 family phage protein